MKVGTDVIGHLGDAWRMCVGTGRAALSLRSDHRDALKLAHDEIGFRHIRGHGLFSDAMAVHRPYEGGTLHSFTYFDMIIDGYLDAGVRPFLELGFMPEALASGPETIFWWKGNITPPKDYEAWARLVRDTLSHLVARYGLDEVRTWPVEVWNEPNLDIFWKDANREEYFRLYEVTARAVKDVDASLQVGGPAVSPGADDWWEPFAEFVTSRDVPVDFLSGHAYTSGPAHEVPFGSYQTFYGSDSLLEQFARPRRILGDHPLAARPLHITEFNSSYRPDNPVHDTAWNAAYLAPTLVGGGDLVDSFSYWTVSDTFEELGVPTALFHGGFGLLTHRQVRKPTYHLYAFMARLGNDVLARGEDHIVTRHPDGRLAILAWQPVGGTDDGPTPDTHTLHLDVPLGTGDGAAFLLRRRVNEVDGNAWTAWRGMGRPRFPDPIQMEEIRAASVPAVEQAQLPVVQGRVEVALSLARHEVTLVELRPVRDETPAWVDDARILSGEPESRTFESVFRIPSTTS